MMNVPSSFVLRLTSLALPLFLTACSSSSDISLTDNQQPIVNIESSVAQKINIKAEPKSIQFSNVTNKQVNIKYGLFWYNKEGVTQLALSQLSPAWYQLELSCKQHKSVKLMPPTPETVNYRLYVMPNLSH